VSGLASSKMRTESDGTRPVPSPAPPHLTSPQMEREKDRQPERERKTDRQSERERESYTDRQTDRAEKRVGGRENESLTGKERMREKVRGRASSKMRTESDGTCPVPSPA